MLEFTCALSEDTGCLDRTEGSRDDHQSGDAAPFVDGLVTVRGCLVREDVSWIPWASDDRRLASVDNRGGRTRRRGAVMALNGNEKGIEPDPSISSNADFDDLMARIRAGDDAAQTLVFRRFVDRLIALAANHFDVWMRNHADIEGVVLSAYKSFFIRNGRGEFNLAGWDDLWALLAYITLRKCGKRQRFVRAARRDRAREVSWPKGDAGVAWLPDRAPTPVEAATLNETVELLLQAMEPDDRPIIEQILMGYTAEQVAKQLDCSERTVRRVRLRAKHRLRRLTGGEIVDEEVG
jgi:RNA polymerase sigma-70 factor, ECF subfamily